MKSTTFLFSILLHALFSFAQMPSDYIIVEKDLGFTDRYVPPLVFYSDSSFKEKDPVFKDGFCKSHAYMSICEPKFFLLNSIDFLAFSMEIPKLEFKQYFYAASETYYIYIHKNNKQTYSYCIHEYGNYQKYYAYFIKIVEKFHLDTKKRNNVLFYLHLT